MLDDLQAVFRALWKRPGFCVIVLVSVALGVGATVTLAQVYHRLLVRPLEVEDPDRLVEMNLFWQREDEADALSYPAFRRYVESEVFQDLAVFADIRANLRRGGKVEVLDGQLVSPGYFRVLGVQAARGRAFTEADPAAPQAVLSWELWQGEFAADEGLTGEAVVLNGHPYTVVGIAPRGFRGLRLAQPVDFWVPVQNLPRIATGFMAEIPVLDLDGVRWLDAVGRLPADVEPAVAAERLGRLARRVETSRNRDVEQLAVELTPLAVAAVGRETQEEITGFLQLLALLVFFELSIICTNIGAVFLARALEQRREEAIRLSLGAPRGLFVRRLLLEGFALTAFATISGLGVAGAVMRWLETVRIPGLPPLDFMDQGASPRLLLLVSGITVASGLLLALPAAWRIGRIDPAEVLKDAAPRFGASRFDLRRGLIAAQVALAVVLLTGTALFVRSLQHAWSVDPGFRSRDVVTASVDLGIYDYDEPRARNFYSALLDRLTAAPAVAAAGWASSRPLGGGRIEMGMEIEGAPRPADAELKVPVVVVSPGFLETLDIPLERGRRLTIADRSGAPPVAVASSRFAERFWMDGQAVGKRIRLRGSDLGPVEIVGTVGDIKLDSLEEEAQSVLYLPMSQHFDLVGLGRMHLLVRRASPDLSVVADIRDLVENLDPNLQLGDIRSMDTVIHQRFAPQQLGASVLGFLGLLALVLVAIGIYGLLTSFVIRQTREIGVRMALGADRSRIVRLMARRSLRPVVAGLVLGLGIAALLLRLIASFLFGVRPLDPWSFLATACCLLVVSMAAGLHPTRRAVSIAPSRALRQE